MEEKEAGGIRATLDQLTIVGGVNSFPPPVSHPSSRRYRHLVKRPRLLTFVILCAAIVAAFHLTSYLHDVVRPLRNTDRCPLAPDVAPNLLLAPRTSPRTLMNDFNHYAERRRFNPILHQTAKHAVLTGCQARWATSWRRDYPGFLAVLWTDEDNALLVKEFFPHIWPAYQALPGEIYRADVARLLYIKAFGGVYVDVDMESIRFGQQMKDLFEERLELAVFAQMGEDENNDFSVPNSFMAGTSGHSFFDLPLQRLLEHHQRGTPAPSPEWLTGSVVLKQSIGEFLSHTGAAKELVVLPSKSVYPFSWIGADPREGEVCSARETSFNASCCKALTLTSESFAISYWRHDWGRHWTQVLAGILGW